MPTVNVNAFATPKYTAREFHTTRAAAIQRITQNTDKWTSFNLAELGMVLLDQNCFESDKLDFYLNRMCEESYIGSAQHYRNVVRLLRLIHVFPDPTAAAEVPVTFTIDVAHSGFDIPAFTQVSDGSAKHVFYLTKKISVGSGETSASGVARNARPVINYTVGVANGDQFFSIKIPLKKMTYGNTRVYGTYRDITTEWEVVDNFIGRDSDERVVKLFHDSKGRGVLLFPDNVEGMIPEKGTVFSVNAWTGGGSDGNLVGTGKINRMLTLVSYVTGVTNTEEPSGGSDLPTKEKLKITGPASIDTNYQPINEEKTRSILESYPGISDVRVVDFDSNVPARLKPTRFWEMWAYISPDLGVYPNSIFLSKLKNYLYERKVVGKRITVKAPIAYTFEHTFLVRLFANSVDPSVARQDIYDALDEYYQDLKQGVNVNLSDWIDLIESVDGVDAVALTDLTVTRSKGLSGETVVYRGSGFRWYKIYPGEKGYASSQYGNYVINFDTPTSR